MKTKKILLIEDDPLLATMYQNKFVQEGFAVETALSSPDGIVKMREFNPDLVLVELIKEADELKNFFAQIKADPQIKKTKVVILADLPLSQLGLVDAKNLGALGILQKADFTPRKLVKKVKTFLD